MKRQQVDCFSCMGNLLTNDASYTREIKSRI